MSSVETLSPSLMQHRRAQALLGRARPRGTGLMFGPLTTSTPAASDADSGGTSPATEASERGRPVPLGRRAGLARVGDHAGERGDGGGQRRAEVDLVVLRAAPAREVAVEGAQALARPRPARGRCPRRRRRWARRRWRPPRAGRRAAPRAPSSRGCGGCPGRPRRRPTARTCWPSQHAGRPPTCPPTRSWCRSRPSPARSRVPSTSRTGTTRSGEPGSATSGSSASRDRARSGRRTRRRHRRPAAASPPRGRGARKYSRVASSDGKTLVVSVSSAPMLQMVARWGSESVAAPGPAVLEDLAAAAAHGVAAQQLEDHVLGRDPRPELRR